MTPPFPLATLRIFSAEIVGGDKALGCYSVSFFLALHLVNDRIRAGNKIEGLLLLFWGPALPIPFKIICNLSKRKG